MLELQIKFMDLPKNYDKHDLSSEAINYTIQLLKVQKKNNNIEGVYNHSSYVISDFEEVNSWAYPVKVVINKKKIIIHILLEVKMQQKVFLLYEH